MEKQTFFDFGKIKLTKEDEERLKPELNDYFKKRERRIRKNLLKKASNINFVSRNEPNLDKMSTERLNQLIKMIESDE
ncbi:hypothetical protein P8917_10075 [Bacillus atrophaeus]|uniref:hypothetical protein n=1 Tax=Bacillus atrophaeus TaxID=1452 RepID=UPI00227E1756|nr:hypothetical protein [Bacillus atrophaeus]MCY8497746.1 hypothetical protein [Bacillus atrophaeus]MCY8814905.1 hypothetical protein [Bacillus atrophaeus]MCY8821549.1 hypothetical protein [Bacillus atrophaeus]MCY8830979.1 hypothetical protein [Bacillus atrophaeus]MCY8835238.1 hypothetical protein [Bacillus atrophaeus]